MFVYAVGIELSSSRIWKQNSGFTSTEIGEQEQATSRDSEARLRTLGWVDPGPSSAVGYPARSAIDYCPTRSGGGG